MASNIVGSTVEAGAFDHDSLVGCSDTLFCVGISRFKKALEFHITSPKSKGQVKGYLYTRSMRSFKLHSLTH